MADSRRVRELAKDVGHGEGPVVRPSGELVFVSMTDSVVYSLKNGKLSVFADMGFYPNGMTEDSDGTLYVTQVGRKFVIPPERMKPEKEGTGGVQIVDTSGNVSWLTRDLISPNDLCFGPDGYPIAVTDPTRGHREDGRLWRCDVKTGEAELLRSLPWYPNGIGFGLDDALYVVNSKDRSIMRFDVTGGKLGKEEVFVKLENCSADGFAFDVEGNLTTGSPSNKLPFPGSVETFDRNGKHIDSFKPSDKDLFSNLALTPDKVLYVMEGDHPGRVLAVENWPHAGLLLYPFRKG